MPRILDAALRCIARWGVAKTTLDDIAREAGCSRATVYRLFPGGKDSLLEALVRSEVERFFDELDSVLRAQDHLEDVLVFGIAHAGRALVGHHALRFVLAHEPEAVLPSMSFSHLDRVLGAVGHFAAPHLAPHVGEDESRRVAEWVARIVISYAMCPADGVDVADEESVRRLVRAFVLPGLVSTITPFSTSAT